MTAPTELDVSAELRLVPLFAELPREVLAELVAVSTQRRAHAGVALVEQGVVSQALMILVRGAAKVVRAGGENGDTTIVLDVMRAPAVLSDVSVFDGRAATAGVVTLRSSHVVAIDRRALFKLAAAHPALGRALLLRAAQDLRAHVRRIDQIVVGAVDERITRLLDSLAEQHGTPLGQGRFIAIPLRRRDLACMVNATTETVSRLLAKFEREGRARSTRDGIWWRLAKAAPLSEPVPAARPSTEPPLSGSVPTAANPGNASPSVVPASGITPTAGAPAEAAEPPPIAGSGRGEG